MHYDDLPEKWKQKIKDHLASKGITDRDKLWCGDFEADKVAYVQFEDESSATFYYPLVIDAPELYETGLFTEHCGYFILNREGVEIRLESA